MKAQWRKREQKEAINGRFKLSLSGLKRRRQRRPPVHLMVYFIGANPLTSMIYRAERRPALVVEINTTSGEQLKRAPKIGWFRCKSNINWCCTNSIQFESRVEMDWIWVSQNDHWSDKNHRVRSRWLKLQIDYSKASELLKSKWICYLLLITYCQINQTRPKCTLNTLLHQ